MATVPRLNRIQPEKTMMPNARIDMQVQDKGSMILNQTSQVAAVGEKVGDIYQQYENDKIDTVSTDLEQKYKQWNDDQLTSLKNQDGDPTKSYVEYDQKAKEKYDELIASTSDASDRVKQHVATRFNKVYQGENIAANKQRGMQQEVYDNNMFESSVKLKKDNLPVVAGYVQAHDPSSFEMFDQGLSDIKSTIIRRGLKKGTVEQLPDDAKEGVDHVYQDDDGKIVKVKLSPLAKVRIAKEQSEGVKNSVAVLLAGGQVEEAKAMREKYKHLIDPVAAVSLDKKFTATGNKDQAYKVIQSVQLTKQDFDSVKNITDETKRQEALKNLKDDKTLQAIENHPDPAVRSEAIKIKNADDSKLQAMRDRKAKSFYNSAASYVLDKQKDGDNPAFHGIADLENDPVYKGMVDHLDAKGRLAIEQMIESPKVSNDKALLKVHKLFMGETDTDLENMTTEQFHHDYLTGLSKVDRNKALKDFTKLKNPSSNEERSSVRDANKQIKEILIKAGHIDSDESYDEDLLKAQGKLRDHLSNRKTMPTTEQLTKLAKGFAAEVIDNKTFRPESVYGKNPASVPSAGNSGQAPTAPTTINKNAADLNPDDVLKNISPSKVVDLKNEFARQFKTQLPTKANPAFLKFVQQQNKG